MSVDQMLAHCSVTYEMAYENKHPKPKFPINLILKLFQKINILKSKSYISKTTFNLVIEEKSKMKEYFEFRKKNK